jgi:hypothetical protein
VLNLFVTKSNDGDSTTVDCRCSCLVVILAVVVHLAVQLDYDFTLVAIEVSNEKCFSTIKINKNRVLPIELETDESSFPYLFPKQALCTRRAFAQITTYLLCHKDKPVVSVDTHRLLFVVQPFRQFRSPLFSRGGGRRRQGLTPLSSLEREQNKMELATETRSTRRKEDQVT